MGRRWRAGFNPPASSRASSIFPALEKERVPAAMSSAILSGVLRQSIGFEGIIVSDALHMPAIVEHYGITRGCIAAVKAGCDLLCLGTGGSGVLDSQITCIEALYQTVESGEIPVARIDEAVERILAVKRIYCTEPPTAMPDFDGHARLNAQVCAQASTWLSQAEASLGGRVLRASAAGVDPNFGLTHADPRSLSFAELAAKALQAPYVILDDSLLPDDYDTLLIGIKVVKPDSPELTVANAAFKQGKRVAFVITGAPYGAFAYELPCRMRILPHSTGGERRSGYSHLP